MLDRITSALLDLEAASFDIASSEFAPVAKKKGGGGSSCSTSTSALCIGVVMDPEELT